MHDENNVKMFTGVCCEPDCNPYVLDHAVLVVGYGKEKSIFKITGWSRIRVTQAGLRKVTYGWLTTGTTGVLPVWQAIRWFDQIQDQYHTELKNTQSPGSATHNTTEQHGHNMAHI
jgi:hypothetical protein